MKGEWFPVPPGWRVEAYVSVPVYDEKTDPPTFLGYRQDAHLTRFVPEPDADAPVVVTAPAAR